MDINYYEKEYEKAVNNNDLYIRYQLCIDLFNTENIPSDVVIKKKKEVLDRALNSARLYIDELIDSGKFVDAEKFCHEAKDKIVNSKLLKNDQFYSISTENFFESFHYRIIDRKYIFNAKSKIEEIEKKSESKIYEVLAIFVTIISIIFAFVNGGKVVILDF